MLWHDPTVGKTRKPIKVVLSKKDYNRLHSGTKTRQAILMLYAPRYGFDLWGRWLVDEVNGTFCWDEEIEFIL